MKGLTMSEEMKNAQRKSYEITKMVKALEKEGNVAIVSNDKGQYCVIMNRPDIKYYDDESVNYNLDISTLEEEWFDNIYDAVKYQYFIWVRDENDTAEITLDLDENLIEELYEIANEKGVIIDEVIIEALEEALSKHAEECDCQSKCPTCGCRV